MRWAGAAAARRRARSGASRRLNVGCGRAPLPGWINVDRQPLPGVDRIVDVRRGLPFRELEAVYAEHFIEHLTFLEAIEFLRSVRSALADGGWIRLSTPNLDWVWATHDPRNAPPEQMLAQGFLTNRAFYGWEHRFLWSEPLLAEALRATGFRDVRSVAYGESDEPTLRGLEQHEPSPDWGGHQHVVVLEARRGDEDPARLQAFYATAHENFVHHLRG